MGVGGQIDGAAREPGVRLVKAYTGLTRFDATRWTHPRQDAWVLDCLNHGRQLQRAGKGRPFLRPSGVAALYAPALSSQPPETAGRTSPSATVSPFSQDTSRPTSKVI